MTPALFAKMPRKVRRLAFNRFRKKSGFMHYRYADYQTKKLILRDLWKEFFTMMAHVPEPASQEEQFEV